MTRDSAVKTVCLSCGTPLPTILQWWTHQCRWPVRITCPTCGVDITQLSLPAREDHVTRCTTAYAILDSESRKTTRTGGE